MTTKKKVKKLDSIFKTEIVHSVYYNDFSAFVNKFYGIKRYGFARTEECGNDSSHIFSTKDLDYPDKYEMSDEMKDFVKQDGAKCYVNNEIFCDLAARGEIPHGNYCVNVCW